jgi:uncharacterized protein YdeI (YjbR/CyaY-like superfamily)
MASPSPTEPIFFDSPEAFRAWLLKHHATAGEVVAGLWRAHARRPTITWGQGIDQALCFGWIDGVRHPLTPDSYSVRFTPRRPGSKWSQVNIEKVKALRAAGLMTPAGEAAFEARVEGGPRAYSPKMDAAFAPGQEEQFRANDEAWAFFGRQPPSWRHKWTWAVASPKSDAARDRRLGKLIEACAAGRRLM